MFKLIHLRNTEVNEAYDHSVLKRNTKPVLIEGNQLDKKIESNICQYLFCRPIIFDLEHLKCNHMLFGQGVAHNFAQSFWQGVSRSVSKVSMF